MYKLNKEDYYQKLVDYRIACEEVGYPYSEALYSNVAHYEIEEEVDFPYELEE